MKTIIKTVAATIITASAFLGMNANARQIQQEPEKRWLGMG